MPRPAPPSPPADRTSPGQVDDQHRHFGIRSGLGPQVAIDDLQAAIWQLANHQGIDEANLGQDAAEGVLLFLGVFSPVLGVRAQVARPDST